MGNTILLVEDEPNDAFFFQRSLQKAGIGNPLQVVRDGREALDYLEGAGPFADRQKYPLPCLVFLDLKLPKATGFEVLEQIRGQPQLRKLIVVVLTSSVSHEDIERAYELGATAYLVKSSDWRQLFPVIQAIKDFWLTYNRPPSLRESRLPPEPQASPNGSG